MDRPRTLAPALLWALPGLFLLVAGVYLIGSRTGSARDIEYLAVVPASDVAGDDMDALLSGLSHRLAGVAPEQLGVIAQTSVKKAVADTTSPDIWNSLGVTHVLRVSPAGDGAFDLELVSGESDRPVWSKRVTHSDPAISDMVDEMSNTLGLRANPDRYRDPARQLLLAARALDERMVDSAVSYLADASEGAPGVSRVMAARARSMALAGNLNGAIELMRGAGRRDPLSTSVAAELGRMFLWADRYRQAVGTCSLAQGLDSANLQAAECVVRARVKLGDLKGAAGAMALVLATAGATDSMVSLLERASPPEGLTRGYSWLIEHRSYEMFGDEDPNFVRARFCGAIDNEPCVLESLGEARDDSAVEMITIGWEPEFDRYRGDPDFDVLVGSDSS